MWPAHDQGHLGLGEPVVYRGLRGRGRTRFRILRRCSLIICNHRFYRALGLWCVSLDPCGQRSWIRCRIQSFFCLARTWVFQDGGTTSQSCHLVLPLLCRVNTLIIFNSNIYAIFPGATVASYTLEVVWSSYVNTTPRVIPKPGPALYSCCVQCFFVVWYCEGCQLCR